LPDRTISAMATRVRERVQARVVGRTQVIDLMLASLIAGGHVLLEGPPGVGKTTLAKSFASAIGGSFKRIQLTPDLLPADITGTAIYDSSKKEFIPRKGPIFANVVMADEMNRASPRTQSAFLEAMQERQVTIDVNTYSLPAPFMVIGTQIPEDTGGLYPLTRTQIDRFALKLDLGLPTPEEEDEILSKSDESEGAEKDPPSSGSSQVLEEVTRLSNESTNMMVSEGVRRYILDLVAGARKVSITPGMPGPRASIWLYRISRSIAMLRGRNYVLPDDVKYVAVPVLVHRLSPLYAEGGAASVERAVASVTKLVEETPVPKE